MVRRHPRRQIPERTVVLLLATAVAGSFLVSLYYSEQSFGKTHETAAILLGQNLRDIHRNLPLLWADQSQRIKAPTGRFRVSSAYPLPSTGVEPVVHYATTTSSGWNNQREGCMVAWVVAYLTDHTLEYKTFHPAYTGVQIDSAIYNHEDLWDLTSLKKHVRVKNISHEKSSEGYDFTFNMDSRFETMDEIRDLKKYNTISYASGWSYMQHIFPWIDPWEEPGRQIFQRMMESFTYSQLIQDTADKVVFKIGTPFIALHVRKLRPPALDCLELGLETVEQHEIIYKRGGCLGMDDWDKAVARLFPSNTLPIYVAHDGSLPSYALQDTHQATDFPFLQTMRPAIISAVEQEIASRAEYFIASAHSSWSEYVIYKRALTKKDGRKNYDIWMKNLAIMDPRPSLTS